MANIKFAQTFAAHRGFNRIASRIPFWVEYSSAFRGWRHYEILTCKALLRRPGLWNDSRDIAGKCLQIPGSHMTYQTADCKHGQITMRVRNYWHAEPISGTRTGIFFKGYTSRYFLLILFARKVTDYATQPLNRPSCVRARLICQGWVRVRGHLPIFQTFLAAESMALSLRPASVRLK